MTTPLRSWLGLACGSEKREQEPSLLLPLKQASRLRGTLVKLLEDAMRMDAFVL